MEQLAKLTCILATLLAVGATTFGPRNRVGMLTLSVYVSGNVLILLGMAIAFTVFEGYTASAQQRYGPLAGLITAVAMFAISTPVIQPALVIGGVFVCAALGRLKEYIHLRYCEDDLGESQTPPMGYSLKALLGSVYAVAILIWLAKSFIGIYSHSR